MDVSTRVDEEVEIASPPADVARFMFDWRNIDARVADLRAARVRAGGVDVDLYEPKHMRP
jgi:hypothetical protein